MGLIASIILGLLALIIVNTILYVLCRKWRWLRWVLPLIVGIVSFFVWGKWWLALLIYLFTFGILLSITETKDKRGRAIHCSNCGYDMPDIEEETDAYIRYHCPKCDNEVVLLKH